MDNCLQTNKKLLFLNEVLQARLFIRDFYLKNTTREVYENVGQLLSVVRMKLGEIILIRDEISKNKIETAGELVAKSIKELRLISQSFFPDKDIQKEQGEINGFKYILEVLYPASKNDIIQKSRKNDIQSELKVIIFKMVLEILQEINEFQREITQFSIDYTKTKIIISITYSGEKIKIKDIISKEPTSLPLPERVQFINGKLTVSNAGPNAVLIKLISPLNVLYG